MFAAEIRLSCEAPELVVLKARGSLPSSFEPRSVCIENNKDKVYLQASLKCEGFISGFAFSLNGCPFRSSPGFIMRHSMCAATLDNTGFAQEVWETTCIKESYYQVIKCESSSFSTTMNTVVQAHHRATGPSSEMRTQSFLISTCNYGPRPGVSNISQWEDGRSQLRSEVAKN